MYMDQLLEFHILETLTSWALFGCLVIWIAVLLRKEYRLRKRRKHPDIKVTWPDKEPMNIDALISAVPKSMRRKVKMDKIGQDW